MFSAIGARALGTTQNVGRLVLFAAQVGRALFPPRFDRREFVRALYFMGNRSIFIIGATAFLAGGLVMVQAAPLVRAYGATSLAGWGAGYAVLREVGPLLIALMFSGRVGAHNTAELATMTVTDQIDGLRVLAIDPMRLLVLPRMLAMVLALIALTVVGDLLALAGTAVVAHWVLDIRIASTYASFADNLAPLDFLHGLSKSVAFGAVIGITSCYFGVTAQGGSAGVGRAVNAGVVTAAVAIMLTNFFLTYVSG